MAFCGGREQKTIIFFSFPEVLWNSILEKFAIICRIERDGINATKFVAGDCNCDVGSLAVRGKNLQRNFGGLKAQLSSTQSIRLTCENRQNVGLGEG